MIINDLFNNKKFVAEEESEAAARRKQYPSYYQHRDAGTVFRTQNDVGQTMNITPDDEEWDDYYRQQFPDMPTPNDGGFWSDDNTAAMVEGMVGKVVFLGTGADGGKYEIIQSSPTDFMIYANGRHIDTYGSLQRAMSVLKNEVQGLQQGMAEGSSESVSFRDMVDVVDEHDPKYYAELSGSDISDKQFERAIVNAYKEIIKKQDVAEGSKMARADKLAKAPKPKNQQEYDAVEKYRKDLAQSYNKEPNFGIKDDEEENKWWIDYDLDEGVAEGSLEEVSQQTLQSYRKKASAQKRAADDVVSGDADDETWKKNVSLSAKRRQGIDAANKRLGVAEDDGFDVVSNYADMRTTDTGNKSNQTYTSTTIQKNPATGQQKSLASWDHTDPKTGKNYSGSNYIDAQGNAEVQKNYEESKNKVNEVSLGDYRKKATVNKALAQTNRFFGRDDPAKVAAADQTIAKRERGLGRADARGRPYTAPPVDQAKQRRDLADKYPNIDELVRQAELNRDPDYEYADGQAYYAGRDAEHNYHRLKQIQRMIRGTELDEMDFGVSQTTDSDTGDVTTNFNQGPMSVSQTKTPGGYTKQTDRTFTLGPATMAQKTVGPNIGAGQLSGTTTSTATNNMTGQAQQQVKGVGFGGATGANVGKNYVGSSDDELAKHAADSFIGTNESVNRMKHLAGIKPAK